MSADDLSERFGLAPWTDFDWNVCGAGVVGMDLASDADLQRDIASVLIARSLGNRSIDYTRKAYMEKFKPHPDQDAYLKALWHNQSSAYNQFYHLIPERDDALLGVFAFDLALVRCRTSFDLLIYAARRGMLIESALLARSLLEQFAYAIAVWGSDSDDLVFKTQPQTVIRELRKVYANAGLAYGALSRLSHFHPHEHYQFIGAEERAITIQRSWKFKIEAVAWLLLTLFVKSAVFKHAYGETKPFADAGLHRAGEEVTICFERIFEGVDLPCIAKIRGMMA